MRREREETDRKEEVRKRGRREGGVAGVVGEYRGGRGRVPLYTRLSKHLYRRAGRLYMQ